jgi:hypothetical protein
MYNLQVFSDRHRLEKSLGFAIFSHIDDAVVHGLPRNTIVDRVALQFRRPATIFAVSVRPDPIRPKRPAISPTALPPSGRLSKAV